jgi:hypothetical protein
MLDRPLEYVRPRWHGPAAFLFVLSVLGAMGAFGQKAWQDADRRAAELALPTVTRVPHFRSATITERRTGLPGEADSSVEIHLDTVDTIVDAPAIERGSRAEIDAMHEFWDEPANAATNVFNATVWVDDTGLVYQVSSKSDVDGAFFQFTIEYSDDPYVPVYPTEFIDGTN